jgi:hypothetical protein
MDLSRLMMYYNQVRSKTDFDADIDIPELKAKISKIHNVEQQEFIMAFIIHYKTLIDGHMNAFAPSICTAKSKNKILPFNIKVLTGLTDSVSLSLEDLPTDLLKMLNTLISG